MSKNADLLGAFFHKLFHRIKELIMRREEISIAALALVVIFSVMFVVVADVVKSSGLAAGLGAAEAKLALKSDSAAMNPDPLVAKINDLKLDLDQDLPDLAPAKLNSSISLKGNSPVVWSLEEDLGFLEGGLSVAKLEDLPAGLGLDLSGIESLKLDQRIVGV